MNVKPSQGFWQTVCHWNVSISASGSGLQRQTCCHVREMAHVCLLRLMFDVLQSPHLERRERERERSGHCICHRVLMQLCVRLTDVRVSQKPCLWLKFHRLTASWLSLLLRRSPWANRQPNREKARLPCLRTTWNTEISHYTFSYANKNTHI